MADFAYLLKLQGMENPEEKATERILLEPYNYLLQLPGKTFSWTKQNNILHGLVTSSQLIYSLRVYSANSQLNKLLYEQ